MLSRSVVELGGPISLNTSSSSGPPPTSFSPPGENSSSVMNMLDVNLDQKSYVDLLTVLNCFFVQIRYLFFSCFLSAFFSHPFQQ